MKHYLILAFKKYGIFQCREVIQYNKQLEETGEIFLIGKFNGTDGEYTFIKHPQDIELSENMLKKLTLTN